MALKIFLTFLVLFLVCLLLQAIFEDDFDEGLYGIASYIVALSGIVSFVGGIISIFAMIWGY